MELSIPLLGVVVTILTLAFAVCLCFAGGCCPSITRYREIRRRNALLRQCKKVRYSLESKGCTNETCPICLDDFRNKESVIVSPCRHGYHQNCIVHCLERSPNCPVCKTTVCDIPETQERAPLLH